MENRIKSKKVTEPLMTTYTQHANLLAVLGTDNRTYEWILSNYIQLYINRDFLLNWGDFYFQYPYEIRSVESCKWITTQKYTRKAINELCGGIINFALYHLKQNSYLNIMIDQYYIPGYYSYNEEHAHHDIFIFDYNDSRQVFLASDFFDRTGYKTIEVKYSDFEKAFLSVMEDTPEDYDYFRGLNYVFSLKNECDYKFDVNNILNAVKEYINQTPPEYWTSYNYSNSKDIIFGSGIYTTLKNYIIRLQNENANIFIDYRPFYLIFDHKKLMLLRMRYLSENNYFTNKNQIIEAFEKLVEQTKILYLTCVKFNIKYNKDAFSQINKMLDYIEKEEEKLLKAYFEL